jgi:putative transcriptional regulator
MAMSTRSLAVWRTVLASLVLLTLAVQSLSSARADETGKPVLLVAKRALKDPLYSSTILLAKPMPNGTHVGFILNRPTRLSLAEMFPEHEPSKKVADPLFLGGPADTNLVFALVADHDGSGDDSLSLTPELSLAYSGTTVDHIIESESERARFFVGLVVWRPGQLDEELKRGLWYVKEPEAKLVLRKKTEGMWDELVRESEVKAEMI